MPKPSVPIARTFRARRGGAFRWTAELRGFDLTGATVHAQVRAFADAPTLLIDLPWTPGAVPGDAVAAATLWTDLTGTLPRSFVGLWIDEHPLLDLEPFATNGTQPGQPLIKALDVVITEPGRDPLCWFAGPFILSPGVTKNA